MVYPDDFDTSAFPAGKRLAVSRTMGIWIMVAFLVIVGICVALPWMRNQQTVNPFVIYVDSARGDWQLVGRPIGDKGATYYQSVQRALVGIFAERWFTITGDAVKNEAMWQRCNRETDCVRRVPNIFANIGGCDIYCISGENMYQNFVKDVLPQYHEYESAGVRWFMNPNQITVFPAGTIKRDGGTWVVRGHVRSNASDDFDVVAYVKVAYDATRYPQTLGYYITGFNAYRE